MCSCPSRAHPLKTVSYWLLGTEPAAHLDGTCTLAGRLQLAAVLLALQAVAAALQAVRDVEIQVQRLLGHASLTTTYIYLDHIATRADTVDAAVEELLTLLPSDASL